MVDRWCYVCHFIGGGKQTRINQPVATVVSNITQTRIQRVKSHRRLSSTTSLSTIPWVSINDAINNNTKKNSNFERYRLFQQAAPSKKLQYNGNPHHTTQTYHDTLPTPTTLPLPMKSGKVRGIHTSHACCNEIVI